MLFRVDDSKVVFATHLLRCTVNRKDKQTARTLARFQVESDGIVCYSQEEVDAAKSTLDKLGISYVVEPQVIAQAIRDKAAQMRYNSRSDAIKHLSAES